MTDHI